MAAATLQAVVGFARRIATCDVRQRTDRQLLDLFSRQRDEVAFAELVRRHGPMVLAACRRVLRNHHDAEDSFQATFLVLAKKAGAIRDRECVGGWLYQVAFRIALRARSNASRRPESLMRADACAAAYVEPFRPGRPPVSTKNWNACRSTIARRWCCAISKAARSSTRPGSWPRRRRASTAG